MRIGCPADLRSPVDQYHVLFVQVRLHLGVAGQAVDRRVTEALFGLAGKRMGAAIAFTGKPAAGADRVLDNGDSRVAKDTVFAQQIPHAEVEFQENSIR
jgi:hypothetical protein